MKYALLTLFALLILVGCMDDDDRRVIPQNAELTIDFRAEYDGQPLRIQSATYDYPTGDELKVGLFQYYVSDLELLRPDADPLPLSEIELIRYQQADGVEVDPRRFTVPTGDYNGVRFGLGVKPSLNAQDPSNFAADFVLNDAEFWNANARYVFAKIEANARIGSSDMFDTGLSYHMGSDAVYRTVTLPLNFTVEQDEKITVAADVLRALASDTEVFDIADPDQQRVHGGNQAVALGIWNRLAGQFRISDR